MSERSAAVLAQVNRVQERRKMVSPRSQGEDMQSAVNGDEEFVDVDGMPPSPPMKRMRGSVTDKVAASGGFPCAFLNPPTPITGVVADEHGLAMVVYDPTVVSASDKSVRVNGANGEGPHFLEPFAIRDCPPGMRIRGGRHMPPIRQAAPKPIEKTKKIQKRKVAFDPAVVTVLSDSDADADAEEKQAGPSRHTVKPAMKKAGVVPMKLKKQQNGHLRNDHRKDHRKDEPRVKFDPTDELSPEIEPRIRVKYVLNQFDNLRRRFLADEEMRVKDKGSGSKRADLKAYNALSKFRSRVNGTESIYGEVPGVEVGDHYFYRMELLLISLHKQSQGGIDYISESKSHFRDDKGRPMSVAVSVIASGGYEDDRDEGDTLMYTGQGGNNYIGDRRQGSDQDLKRGNLALKNCKDLGLSVRVIRGCNYKKSPMSQGSSPSGRIYYYDGMYDVVDCYQDQGSAGFKVWKYKLVRKHGQKALSSSLVIFKGKALPPVLRDRGERIISEDLSNGLEPFKVRVVACLDDDRVPDNFEYIKSLRYSPGLPKPVRPAPCPCSRDCFGRNGCTCMSLNGEQPYNDEGGLLRAKRLVYECGPTCRCAAAGKCINRVSQNGLRYELEVFKTKGKGWGVRSSYFIQQGTFVCEYIGEIIHETDAEKRVSDDEYMFDLKIPDSMERRFGQISGLFRKNGSSSDEDDDDVDCQDYTVDANRCGNLARFINHSCDPNLFVQCVLYDHHDHRFPHIMLFAAEHISPYKELTYDYGYELGTVIGKDGKIKKKDCYCGSRNCRGRMY